MRSLPSTARHCAGGKTVLLAPVLALCLLAVPAARADYVFTTVDYPGAASTDVRGINNTGEIVGYAQNSSGTFGFKYSGGHFTHLPPAPGWRISAHGINDSGVIVGSAHASDDSSTVGFILDGSTYTFFSYPGLDRTYARAIGNDGTVTGYAEDDGFVLNRGFIYHPVTAAFTDIVIPGALQVIAQGINDAGQVVGNGYSDPPAGVQAFLRDPGTGALTLFQIDGRATRARGISNTGLITGFHDDATGRVAAFVGHSGGYQLLYVNPTDDTIGEAINDSGQISGLYGDFGSGTHGFIATPAALPTGTTASGAYVFGVDVIANVPIFIDPEVTLGYEYRTGKGDPAFVTVRLPIGIGDNQYTLVIGGRQYPLAAGELFDFRAHGHADGVRSFRVTDIELDAALDPRNPYAFPTQVSFGASGRFTGTMAPLCRRQPLPPQAGQALRRALQHCRP
jgi:probable HAF family extracellular repeat protein